MAGRFGLALGLEQDVACLRCVALLGIKIPKREHHEGKEQTDFVLPRKQ